jgi:hypothetical protein
MDKALGRKEDLNINLECLMLKPQLAGIQHKELVNVIADVEHTRAETLTALDWGD